MSPVLPGFPCAHRGSLPLGLTQELCPRGSSQYPFLHRGLVRLSLSSVFKGVQGKVLESRRREKGTRLAVLEELLQIPLVLRPCPKHLCLPHSPTTVLERK